MTFIITPPSFSDESIQLLQETTEMLTQVPNAIAQLQNLLQTTEDERIEVANALNGLRTQIGSLSTNVTTLTEQNATQEQSLTNQAQTIAALQQTLASQGVDISAFQQIINDLTAQNATLQSTNSDLNGYMSQIEFDLGVAINKVEEIYTEVAPEPGSGGAGN
jgi:chromosome segregation ATPase